MDVVFDLVDVHGCIYLKRLRLRAMARGVSLQDFEYSLDAWQDLGIFSIEHGIVFMIG